MAQSLNIKASLNVRLVGLSSTIAIGYCWPRLYYRAETALRTFSSGTNLLLLLKVTVDDVSASRNLTGLVALISWRKFN